MSEGGVFVWRRGPGSRWRRGVERGTEVNRQCSSSLQATATIAAFIKAKGDRFDDTLGP